MAIKRRGSRAFLFRRFDEELRGDRVLEQAVTVLGEIERLVVPCGIVLRIQDEGSAAGHPLGPGGAGGPALAHS